MTVLRVLLVACVLVLVGASADASASSTATGTWTLNITFAGKGLGLVTTSPAGILCTNENPDTAAGTIPQPQGTCSAHFPAGIVPFVIANPLGYPSGGPPLGYLLGGFSNNCEVEEKAHGSCQVREDASGAPSVVQVTFNANQPCIVRRVIDQPLAQAKQNLREHGCSVGKIRHVYSRLNINFGEVIEQSPRPHWQRQHGAVNLVVSKGRRGP